MGTTRKTVRKVRDLYLDKGWEGLKDSRNGPNIPHNKIGPAWEYSILSEYQKGPIKTVTSFRLWFNNKYDTTFSKDVYQASHSLIPPGACWKQGYIESFNNLCEQHFYKVEEFTSLKDFLSKAYTYQLGYNLVRQSESLGKKTPYQVAKKYYPGLSPEFYQLPPVVYNGNEWAPKIVEDSVLGGYHLHQKTIVIFKYKCQGQQK